jgi:hypothetical protein
MKFLQTTSTKKIRKFVWAEFWTDDAPNAWRSVTAGLQGAVNENSQLFLRTLVNSRSSRRESVDFITFSGSEFNNLQGKVRGWEDKCDIGQSGSESQTFERRVWPLSMTLCYTYHANNDNIQKQLCEPHSHMTCTLYNCLKYFPRKDIWPQDKEYSLLSHQ